MASTYTNNNGIEKPAPGDQNGTWGTTVDNNYDLIDQALDGIATIALTGPTYSLSFTDGALCDARSRILIFTGSPTVPVTVTISQDAKNLVPPQKFYIVVNETSTSQSITLKCSAGTSYTLTSFRESMLIYCDGNGNVYPVPSVSQSPVSVSLTNNSVVALADGQSNVIFTGTPTGNPATITLTPATAGLVWVANTTATPLSIVSGGSSSFFMAPGAASPIYLDNAGHVYGAQDGNNQSQNLPVTNVTQTAALNQGIRLLYLSGNPFVNATVTIGNAAQPAMFLASNATPYTVTLKASANGVTAVLPSGNSALIWCDGAGNISNWYQSSIYALGAITTGSISANGNLTVNGSAAITGNTNVSGSVSASAITTPQANVTALSCGNATISNLTLPGAALWTPACVPTAGGTANITVNQSWYYILASYLVMFQLNVVVTLSVAQSYLTFTMPAGMSANFPPSFNGQASAPSLNGGQTTGLNAYIQDLNDLICVPDGPQGFPANSPIRLVITGFYIHA